MAPVYADHPFPLIPAPSKLPAPGEEADGYEQVAGEMCCVHNCFIRAINAIYLQAPHIKDADVVPFCEFAHVFYSMLHVHHEHEEETFFPGIEAITGEPGIMETNIQQHHAFGAGLEEYGKYTRACADGTEMYDGARLVQIIDSFAPVLIEHLTDEITSLLGLKKYGKEKYAKYRAVFDATGQQAIDSSGFTTGLVFVCVCCDKSYEGGRWKNFPPAPAPVLFVVRYIASMVHSSWWKFAPGSHKFQMKALYAVPEDA